MANLMQKAAFAILLLSALQAWPVSARPLSLREAFLSALEKTEPVQIRQAQLSQAEEGVSQAWGSLLPSISATAAYLRQDTENGLSEGSVSSAFRRADQTSAQITLSQPLFRGFSEFAALRAARDAADAQRFLVTYEKATLYRSVAAAYYQVLAEEADHAHLSSLLQLTNERIDELTAREKIGKSKPSEVLFARSQAAITEAEIQAAAERVRIARSQFALVTGLADQTELTSPLRFPKEIKPIAFYLEKAKSRGDVLAAQSAFEAAEEGVVVARSGHFPSLDLEGNYYLKRTGILEGAKWDVSLNLTLPIFQGGIVHSQIGAAAERARELELTLSYNRRSARSEIETFHHQVDSLLKQMTNLNKAVRAAEKSYNATRRDFRYGLVTHLELLQALNTTIETKRSLDRARFQLFTALVSLESASGIAPEGDPS